MSGFSKERNSRINSGLMTRKHLDSVDVVIIGAGCGGAAFAWQIKRQAPHLKVVCLERGGWPDQHRMPVVARELNALSAYTWVDNAFVEAAPGNAVSAPPKLKSTNGSTNTGR